MLVRVVLVAVALATTGDAAASPVVSQGGAVAADHRLASAAGVEILRAGGNAVDAAVAAALAGGVVNPSSAGLGGGGFMVIYLADQDAVHTIDYRETAPSGAHRDMYVHDGKVDTRASKKGGLAVAVPGEAAGLATALARFGKLSMQTVAAPAIRLAEDGFRVEPHLAASMARYADALGADAALARAFLDDDATTYSEGQLMRRPGLARALHQLAAHGPAPFYSGAIAASIVAAVAASGGIITAADLESYRPLERDAVVVDYRHWRIVGMSPPSSGGGTIGAALAILEPYTLADLGPHSATYYHLLAEILKAVFAERASYYGDPDFTDVPLTWLLSPGHAAKIRARLRPHQVVPASVYGHQVTASDSGTSHISVIDAAGNAVACTTSINTGFGAKVGVPDYGIVLNNTMDDFSLQPGVPNIYGLTGSQANSIAGGKRPLSSMSPTLVIGSAGVRLALGASGGPLIISATLQTLINVLDFSMDVATAVAAPRLHHQWAPDQLGVEKGIPSVVRASLARIGHEQSVMAFSGAVQAVESLPIDQQRWVRAVSDPRKGGLAAAQ